MEYFFVYHVVTERPMQKGQKIRFDEQHHSGVYERVMAKENTVKDIYLHPQSYTLDALDYPTKVALRELALEKVRLEKYPFFPSRLASLYVSANMQDAQIWANYFLSLGRTVYQLVRLKVSGQRFTGDAHNCFDGTLDEKENLQFAEDYWENRKNRKNEPPLWETIVNGDIEVVEILKTYT